MIKNSDSADSDDNKAREKQKPKKTSKALRYRNLSKIKTLPSEDPTLANSNDAKAMLQKVAEMYEDLEERLEYIQQNLHLLPDHLQKYLRQPEKMIENHDKLIEKFQKQIEDKFGSILGKLNFVEESKKRMHKKGKKRGRQAQKLRAKKKWIPMD